LTALVCAVFSPILAFEFVNWDVTVQLLDNPRIQGLSVDNLKYIFSSWCVNSYYPIRALSYAVDYQIWGLEPKGFKLTNGLIHLTNVLLVFWLILRLFRYADRADVTRRPWREASAAAYAASIFAIHPVVVEPVAWVPGREELLMTLGALGCFHFHLAARRVGDKGHGKGIRVALHVAAALCCALACLSNAVAAAIPLLITAWDVHTLPRPKLRRIVSGTFALWALGAATIAIKRLGEAANAVGIEPEIPAFPRWMLIPKVYWLNLKTLVWPTQLTLNYGNQAPRGWNDREMILGWVALGLTCVILWKLRRRFVLFGLLWFGLALAPTSHIMLQHIHRADRFLYLPLVGLAVAAALALRSLANAVKGRVALAGLIVAGGCLHLLELILLSTGQVQTWRNSVTLWEHGVRIDPTNVYVWGCLADGLWERGQFDLAVPFFERCLQLEPNDPEILRAYAHRLTTCDQEAFHDNQRAIELATRGCEITAWTDRRLRRVLSTAHMNLAIALKGEGQFGRAVQSYKDANVADPSYDMPLFNLALLLATCSDPQFRRPDEAIRVAETVFNSVKRPNPRQLSMLAEIYAETGRWGQAVALAERAIQLPEAKRDPEMIETLQNRLDRYRRRGKGPFVPSTDY
jgi:tetratricopeptide (TPR) repeat protein